MKDRTGHVAGWAVDILGRCGAEARLRDVSEGELLIGDGVTQGIVRIGDTVRRPLRPFSLTVQAYLAHPRDAGQDATSLYHDPHLLGHIFAAPYGLFEPSLAFVAEDAAGMPCGCRRK